MAVDWKGFIAVGAVALTLPSGAWAQWRDVSYNGVSPADYVYCNKQSDLDAFGAVAQDGDQAGADRLVSQGRCHVSSGMRVEVFQQNEYAVTFLSPSGRAFYTYTKFVRKR
ncbi:MULTISPECIES: hypothetical protein [Pseudomonas]|uniref:hypothetical protein n=1 Tax=Pseudomonas TaxID=286 RepID=UPI001AE89C21|nr:MULTISPECIES: hypothetical protein [Pseudomonas]MBP2084152.1 hypothetical protein [Pseudomonas sp. PvP089]MBP2090146.1 hypothetical protein [Pseudomonas sp. PvP088]MBP2223690.1 hypothetical protein [Pseudomonas putida]